MSIATTPLTPHAESEGLLREAMAELIYGWCPKVIYDAVAKPKPDNRVVTWRELNTHGCFGWEPGWAAQCRERADAVLSLRTPPAPAREGDLPPDAIAAYDDGTHVELDSYSGGGSPEGLWGKLALAFVAADGSRQVRKYTANGPTHDYVLLAHPAAPKAEQGGERFERAELPEGQSPVGEGWERTHMTISGVANGERRIWMRPVTLAPKAEQDAAQPDVCKHGIRKPWACDPCDKAAWARHQAALTPKAESAPSAGASSERAFLIVPQGMLIPWVKAHQTQFRSGLKEAKEAVEGGWRPGGPALSIPTLLAERDELRAVLDGIAVYAADTLSGRADGEADGHWHRDGFREIYRRVQEAGVERKWANL